MASKHFSSVVKLYIKVQFKKNVAYMHMYKEIV